MALGPDGTLQPGFTQQDVIELLRLGRIDESMARALLKNVLIRAGVTDLEQLDMQTSNILSGAGIAGGLPPTGGPPTTFVPDPGAVAPSPVTVTGPPPGGFGFTPRTSEEDIFAAQFPGETAAEIARQAATTTEGGRFDLFNQFLASSPQLQAANPTFRRFATTRFNPLSAQFFGQNLARLTGMPDPTGGVTPSMETDLFPTTFTQFLGGRPQPAGRQGFFDFARQIAPVFTGPEEGLTLNQQVALAALGPNQDPEVKNFITQALTAGTNPFISRFAPEILGRGFAAFRGENPLTSLLVPFLKGQFGGF